jgi:hypothetical protein
MKTTISYQTFNSFLAIRIITLCHDTVTWVWIMSADTKQIHNGKFRNTLSVPSCVVHTTYEDWTACSEMSAYKIQTPGNPPKERVWHSNPCLWLEKTCVFHFPVLANGINICIYVYRGFCVIVAEGNWYMDGKWILTAADGHLALLAN